MSAGKLIYFHYDVLLCLLLFFNIHFLFLEQHFVFETQQEYSLCKTFFIHFPFILFHIMPCTASRDECTMLRIRSYCISRGVSYPSPMLTSPHHPLVSDEIKKSAISAEKQLFFSRSPRKFIDEKQKQFSLDELHAGILNFHIYAFN